MNSINQNELIKTLESLTEEQQIHIANILGKDIKFSCYKQPECSCHDLVSSMDHCENGLFRYIVQIDYRDVPFSKLNERFRFYEDLYEYHASSDDLKTILDYLNAINPHIQN